LRLYPLELFQGESEMRGISIITLGSLLLGGCGGGPHDPRGLRPGETLLQVSATGEATAQPDQASFSAMATGVGATSIDASNRATAIMTKILAALEAKGIAKADIQTQNVSVDKQDYGPNRGKYEASNSILVTVKKVADAGAVLAAATTAGARITGGPNLTMADPGAANRAAIGAAFKSAQSRADAYAKAAGMTVVRVLTIRDGNAETQDAPNWAGDAAASAAPMAKPLPINPGTTSSFSTVSVDFALSK
jgi:uncharacterized protein